MKKILLLILIAFPLSSFAFDVNLKPGSTGPEVTKIQKFLIEKGYLQTNSFGTYGPATKRAVMAFQKVSGLPQSGSWLNLTREKAKLASSLPVTNTQVTTNTQVATNNQIDLCKNIDGIQTSVPTWYARSDFGTCELDDSIRLKKLADDKRALDYAQQNAYVSNENDTRAKVQAINNEIEIYVDNNFTFTSGCNSTDNDCKYNFTINALLDKKAELLKGTEMAKTFRDRDMQAIMSYVRSVNNYQYMPGVDYKTSSEDIRKTIAKRYFYIISLTLSNN